MNICLKSVLDPAFHLPREFNRITGVSLFTLDIVNLICVCLLKYLVLLKLQNHRALKLKVCVHLVTKFCVQFPDRERVICYKY